MNSKDLEKKVKQATSEIVFQKGYVSSVDVLIKIGIISQKDYQDWRLGKIPYLEKACQANLQSLSTVNSLIRKYSEVWNLEPSWTAYNKWGDGPKLRLIFSKSGDQKIEDFYATHFLNKKRINELKLEKQIKISSSQLVQKKNKEHHLSRP